MNDSNDYEAQVLDADSAIEDNEPMDWGHTRGVDFGVANLKNTMQALALLIFVIVTLVAAIPILRALFPH